MAIKEARGRLDFPMSKLDDTLNAFGFLVLPITLQHAIAAGALPRHHADPFDRMLVAQARVEGLTLVTADARIRLYEVPILNS
jgi:PIN domain nuclease of toxin-antitoxin system